MFVNAFHTIGAIENSGLSTFPEIGISKSIIPFESSSKAIANSKGKDTESSLFTLFPNFISLIIILFLASRFDFLILYFKSRFNFPVSISLPINFPE